MRNEGGSFLSFQSVGSTEANGGLLTLISERDKGINCAEWCMQKLDKAEITLNVKPIPNRVAGDLCVIL